MINHRLFLFTISFSLIDFSNHLITQQFGEMCHSCACIEFDYYSSNNSKPLILRTHCSEKEI